MVFLFKIKIASVTLGSRLINEAKRPNELNTINKANKNDTNNKEQIDYLLDSPIVMRKLYESNDVETQKKYVKKYLRYYIISRSIPINLNYN